MADDTELAIVLMCAALNIQTSDGVKGWPTVEEKDRADWFRMAAAARAHIAAETAPMAAATCATCPAWYRDTDLGNDPAWGECRLDTRMYPKTGLVWPRVRQDHWCTRHPARRAAMEAKP